MASIYRLYDRDFNVMNKVLVYGKDFTDNHIEDVLEDGDSTLTLECLGGCIPEEIQVEGYIETDNQISGIKEVSGTQLDSEVVNAFLSLVDKGILKDVDDKTAGALGDVDEPEDDNKS